MSRKKREPEVEQPTLEQQREYASLVADTPTLVSIPSTKKKYRIRWLKAGTIAKLSRLLIGSKDTDNDDDNEENVLNAIIEDSKLACKAAACITLNGYWSIRFRYWVRWRWFYYVKQYSSVMLQPIIETGKKKVPLVQFLHTTTLLIGVKDTLMQMRTAEVEHILHEQLSAQLSQVQKKDNGLSQQDTSVSAS